MTITVNEYLEQYLVMLGWVLNNRFWMILMETGLALIPLIVFLVGSWLDTRAKGADVGSKAKFSLSNSETRLWVAIAVVILTCVPVVDVNIDMVDISQNRKAQCYYEINGKMPEGPNSIDESSWSESFSELGGQSARMPAWWALVTAISRGVTNAAMSTIPCTANLRHISMSIQSERIHDAALLSEIQKFSTDCFGMSRRKLANSNINLNEAENNDTWWIGSHYFQSTPGFYDYYHAQTPIAGFPFDPNRDEGLKDTGRGGYPKCNEWWGDSSAGLRQRIVDQVDPTLWTQIKGAFTNSPSAEIEDATIRQLVSPEQVNKSVSRDKLYASYSTDRNMSGKVKDYLANMAGNIGVYAGSPAHLSKMNMIQYAMPKLQIIFLMIITIILPVIAVSGGYDIKPIITTSFVLFALHFMSFWFFLASWIENSMLQAMSADMASNWPSLLGATTGAMGQLNYLASGDTAAQNVMKLFIIPALFIILPGMFMLAISWAGIIAGSEISKGVSGSTDSTGAGNAGAAGANTIKSAATTAATRGMKK